MTRRSFLNSVPTATLPAWAQRNPAPPNVVIMLADDLGWADTTPYGADLHETPNLAHLASESVRFTNAYAAAPVCSPTRASIMTGKSPARLNMTVWYEQSQSPPANMPLIPPVTRGDLPHAELTIAEVLHERGYRTAHIGKWHLGTAGFYPETQGFDINIGGAFWGAPQTFFYPYRGSKRFGGEFRYVPHMEGGKPGEYLTDRLGTEAVRFIEDAKSAPFFLNLWFHNPHTPIEAKEELARHYASRVRPEGKHRNPVYAAMIHSLDENVGRVLRKLDETGLADRTIVIFASDNGGYIGKFDGETVTNNYPLRSGKGSLYEGGIRIPMLVRRAGAKAKGGVCHEPVVTTDLLPTIVELTGSSVPDSTRAALEGQSLMPLLENADGSLPREDLFFHYPHYYATTSPVSAIRSRDWKLLFYYEDRRTELYNLAKDPGENSDLSKEMPAKARELQTRLQSWLNSVNAQMPKPNVSFNKR